MSTKFLRSGKVVIVLSGRYAGKKAVIVKVAEPTEKRPYLHALIAGLESSPLKITKSMGQKRIAKRSRVKPFIKAINVTHLMPTRYAFELELKNVVPAEELKDPAQRSEVRKKLRTAFEERFKSGKNKWFFQKLRF